MNNEKFIQEYYQYLLIEKNYSKNTIESYIRDIDQFVQQTNNMNLLENTLEITESYLRWLRDSFSNNSVLRKISSLKNFYKYLLANNYVEKNFFAEISVSKKTLQLPKFLTQDEINLFLNSLKLTTPLEIRNKAMFELIYATGMRISELTNLKLEDVNISEQLIRVTGKGRKERIVPINSVALKYLILYINEARLSLNHNNIDYLFLNKNGGQLTRQGFYKILKQLAQQVGITDISPHKFRHSIATHMLNNGANLKVVQEMLGHENISTTEIYTHVNKKQLIDDYNKYHIFGDDNSK